MSVGKSGKTPQNPYVTLEPSSQQGNNSGPVSSHSPGKSIPESAKNHQNEKPVKSRKAEVVSVPNGPFARLKAFILRQPEPAEIHHIEKLIEALTSRSDDLSMPVNFKKLTATIDKGSPEHNACAWLAEVGLLKMEASSPGEMKVRMLRPRKLKVQSETASKLSDLMPAELGKDGTLKLDSMLRKVDYRRQNDLQLSRLLTFDSSKQKHVVDARSRKLMKFDRFQDQFQNRMAAPRMYWAGRFRALAKSGRYDEEVKPTVQEVANKFRYNVSSDSVWINEQDADSKADDFKKFGCPELESEVLQAKEDCPWQGIVLK
ncbi:hypothetical protein [Endozoicomonas arenosclerae]|uniref:hypothetical protein n=1 Tax=Endozoicomonas arenosclerae TaxID=1633495 RepID=UPI00078142B8|nr:hypothetical protein [Endozoicomonas arenosclerae]